jgi:short-subunit dehydrogenase
MSHELREFGIHVLVITPYYVISNQFRRKAPTYIAPAAETVVQQTLPLLGHVDKAYPYFVHAACGALADVYWDVGGKVVEVMKRNRARALEVAAAKKNKAS